VSHYSLRPSVTELTRFQLAQEAGRQLHDEGVTTRLHLLDVDATPDVDASTLVVSLGGDGTFSSPLGSPMRWARGCSRSTWADWVPPECSVERSCRRREVRSFGRRRGRTIGPLISVSGTKLEEFALNEVVVERAHAGHMVRVKTRSMTTNSSRTPRTASWSPRRRAAPATTSRPAGRSSKRRCRDDLTPVAPHFTIDRSIVVADDKVIRLVAQDKPAIIVADGQDLARSTLVSSSKCARALTGSRRRHAQLRSRVAPPRGPSRGSCLSLSCWSCTPTDWA